MMHVKVKARDIRLSIPIPYFMLTIAVSVLCSSFIQRNLNKWTKKPFERYKLDFIFPKVDKQTLRPIVKELKKNKGIVLVNVKAEDGTEVRIRL